MAYYTNNNMSPIQSSISPNYFAILLNKVNKDNQVSIEIQFEYVCMAAVIDGIDILQRETLAHNTFPPAASRSVRIPISLFLQPFNLNEKKQEKKKLVNTRHSLSSIPKCIFEPPRLRATLISHCRICHIHAEAQHGDAELKPSSFDETRTKHQKQIAAMMGFVHEINCND